MFFAIITHDIKPLHSACKDRGSLLATYKGLSRFSLILCDVQFKVLVFDWRKDKVSCSLGLHWQICSSLFSVESSSNLNIAQFHPDASAD